MIESKINKNQSINLEEENNFLKIEILEAKLMLYERGKNESYSPGQTDIERKEGRKQRIWT